MFYCLTNGSNLGIEFWDFVFFLKKNKFVIWFSAVAENVYFFFLPAFPKQHSISFGEKTLIIRANVFLFVSFSERFKTSLWSVVAWDYASQPHGS